jgi:hypothetical protein
MRKKPEAYLVGISWTVTQFILLTCADGHFSIHIHIRTLTVYVLKHGQEAYKSNCQRRWILNMLKCKKLLKFCNIFSNYKHAIAQFSEFTSYQTIISELFRNTKKRSHHSCTGSDVLVKEGCMNQADLCLLSPGIQISVRRWNEGRHAIFYALTEISVGQCSLTSMCEGRYSPMAHTSTGGPYWVSPTRSSGALYHRVAT